MRRIVQTAVCLVGLGLVALAEPPKSDPPRHAAIEKALETFTGTWEIRVVKPDGASKDARRLVFRKDGTYAAQDAQGKELWAGTFDIDPTTDPKIWDHRSHDRKKMGSDVLGIYELQGDTLKVACVVGEWRDGQWVGKARPKRIDADDADVRIEMNRVKAVK